MLQDVGQALINWDFAARLVAYRNWTWRILAGDEHANACAFCTGGSAAVRVQEYPGWSAAIRKAEVTALRKGRDQEGIKQSSQHTCNHKPCMSRAMLAPLVFSDIQAMTALARPAKKARTSTVGHDKALADIAAIEKQLTASASTDLNPLVDLIDIFSNAASDTASTKVAARNRQLRVASAYSLHIVFASLIRQGRLIGKVKLDESNPALAAVRDWTRLRWNGYVDKLCTLLSDRHAGLAVSARICACLEY